MNAPRILVPPTKALRRLDQFLQEIASPLTATDAATQAIDQWIAVQRGHPVRPNLAPARGYQWKSLFLPEGTELRVSSATGANCYARVIGEHILYEHQRVSPRQFCLAVFGSGRNAWRDVWILLPGESKWRPASLLRRQAGPGLEARPPTISPQEALGAAARCMADSLRAALALVDHVTGQDGAAALGEWIDRSVPFDD